MYVFWIKTCIWCGTTHLHYPKVNIQIEGVLLNPLKSNVHFYLLFKNKCQITVIISWYSLYRVNAYLDVGWKKRQFLKFSKIKTFSGVNCNNWYLWQPFCIVISYVSVKVLQITDSSHFIMTVYATLALKHSYEKHFWLSSYWKGKVGRSYYIVQDLYYSLVSVFCM